MKPGSMSNFILYLIMSSTKNRMTTRVITLCRVYVTSLTTSVSTVRSLIEIMFILKVIKSQFSGSYDKQNLTLVVISYEIYENRHVRSSVYASCASGLLYPLTLIN